ncbi:heme oxygenase-like protein [Annulohypoxylon bovei var. microspora]|nr:heme oxygenase-like protein [Annulohypoxylon bovei var. microspora]
MPSKTQDAGATPEFRTLGESINIATRPVHTSLNKLIILRLRLALPPHADDASNYVQGLLHIAPIYLTFESLWQDILSTPPGPSDSSPVPGDSNPGLSPKISPRIHALLTNAHFAALSRSAALKADLRAMTGWRADELAARLREAPLESPVLAGFLARIRRGTARGPHVLLAYAWVLYMALFAGGRFIRASLERVDPADRFWGPLYEDGGASPDLEDDEGEAEEERGHEKGRQRMPGAFPSSASVSTSRELGHAEVGGQTEADYRHPLSFFRFDTPADGQDLRQAFKARVAEATEILTPSEVEDVVAEARDIFERMVGVVGELDEVCGTEYEAAAAA